MPLVNGCVNCALFNGVPETSVRRKVSRLISDYTVRMFR